MVASLEQHRQESGVFSSNIQHVPAWEGNIRYVLLRRMAELGHNITFTLTGKQDEHGNDMIDATLDTPDTSHAYYKYFNGPEVRELRRITRGNPYSPNRPKWIKEGIPAQPSVRNPNYMLPPVIGLQELVKPPIQTVKQVAA